MSDKKNHILFVVEGEKREMGIFDSLSKVFFNEKSDATSLPVPAEMNIYMLYNLLKKDDFETDVIEVLRENVPDVNRKLDNKTRDDFSEIYYFFDFDEHAKNIHKTNNVDALSEMLNKLNNETELGKLYISYPMVEATRDYVINICKAMNGECFRSRHDFQSYKRDSGINHENNDFRKINYEKWGKIIECYVYRSSCLFKMKSLNRDYFVNTITPLSLFEKEKEFYDKEEKVFIISCIPEFLIDYSEKYWTSTIKKRKKPVLDKRCKEKIA